MGYFRLSLFAAAVVVGACVIHHTTASVSGIAWKDLPPVKHFLETHPAAKRMTEGPLDDLIDLLIALLIYVINIILAQPLMNQLVDLDGRVKALGG